MAPVKTVFRFLIIRIHNKHPDLQPVIINIIIQPVHGRINDFIREGVTHKHGLNLLRGKNGSVFRLCGKYNGYHHGFPYCKSEEPRLPAAVS